MMFGRPGGSKGSLYEGGHRVPFIVTVRMHGVTPPNTFQCDYWLTFRHTPNTFQSVFETWPVQIIIFYGQFSSISAFSMEDSKRHFGLIAGAMSILCTGPGSPGGSGGSLVDCRCRLVRVVFTSITEDLLKIY